MSEEIKGSLQLVKEDAKRRVYDINLRHLGIAGTVYVLRSSIFFKRLILDRKDIDKVLDE